MKLAIFGLTISSSWGNGHATLWRGLCRALTGAGHEVVFFERDVPYYRAQRDEGPYGCDWVLYDDWMNVVRKAERIVSDCDVAMVTSYCPDASEACRLVLGSRVGTKAFYDLDTPVTLARLARGEAVEYLPSFGLGDFDLVLSYAGGPALDELRSRLRARRVAPLYGSVDVTGYRPVSPSDTFAGDMSYLGTFASDRHDSFRAYFLDLARELPERSFVLGGALYPEACSFPPNVRHFRHVPPSEHPSFFCSSGLTLNITRKPMRELGWCPSGRLFEAAACGAAIVSDSWEGLDSFFEPGREILLAESADDVRAALDLGAVERDRIGRRARERALAEHCAEARAKQLVDSLSSVGDGARTTTG